MRRVFAFCFWVFCTVRFANFLTNSVGENICMHKCCTRTCRGMPQIRYGFFPFANFNIYIATFNTLRAVKIGKKAILTLWKCVLYARRGVADSNKSIKSCFAVCLTVFLSLCSYERRDFCCCYSYRHKIWHEAAYIAWADNRLLKF